MQWPTRFCPSPADLAQRREDFVRLAPWLEVGDPLADAALAVIDGAGARGRAWLETLVRGERADDAPSELQALHAALQPPMWVDWQRTERGARVLLSSGILAGVTLAGKSILLGYASPGGNKPLALSGALTKRAPRRLSETSRYVRAVLLPRGLAPGGEGYALSVRVRLMHARVRALALADARWQRAAWGVPINQHDMAATSILFSEVLLQGLETLGARITPADGDAVMHLWRHAGHLMGVSHELLPTSRSEAKRLMDLIEASQAAPDDDARALTRALFDVPDREAEMAPPEERAAAQRVAYRSRELVRVAAYELLGAKRARSLGIEPSLWRGALPLLRRLVGTTSLLTRTVRAAEERAVEAGRRYWDQVRDQGLLRYDIGFSLPERLE